MAEVRVLSFKGNPPFLIGCCVDATVRLGHMRFFMSRQLVSSKQTSESWDRGTTAFDNLILLMTAYLFFFFFTVLIHWWQDIHPSSTQGERIAQGCEYQQVGYLGVRHIKTCPPPLSQQSKGETALNECGVIHHWSEERLRQHPLTRE